ncbi:MAG: hypothetical protein ABI665_02410 [Vicinamibacterales bacterium]
MTYQRLTCFGALLWLLIVVMPAVQAANKPQLVSVRVTFEDPPADMKTGDEATTTLVFRALVDTDRLDIFLVPDDGLELVATATAAVFTNIKAGETRQLQVKVKLTDPKGSSLNVSFGTVYNMEDEGYGSTVVDYGDPRGY